MITSETIAFIGLGNMGSAMAQRLLDAGYPLRVYNRSEGKDTCIRAGCPEMPLDHALGGQDKEELVHMFEPTNGTEGGHCGE